MLDTYFFIKIIAWLMLKDKKFISAVSLFILCSDGLPWASKSFR